VEEITAIQDGKLGKGLKKFLSDEIVAKGKGKEQLMVADNKLGELDSIQSDKFPC
jgi:nucleolar protein 58